MTVNDIAKFEKECLEALSVITAPTYASSRKVAATRSRTTDSSVSKRPRKDTITQERKDSLYRQANNYLKNSEVLKLLCPGLKGIEGTITDVLKKLITILIPASAASLVVIPVDPYLYAMLAFVVVKFGIDTICPKR